MIDRVPVTAVRDLGADFVIAVDVAPREATAKVEGIFDVIIQTIGLMEREIMSNQLLSADVAIFPDVAEFSPTAFTQVEKCIQRGRGGRTGTGEADQGVDPGAGRCEGKWRLSGGPGVLD